MQGTLYAAFTLADSVGLGQEEHADAQQVRLVESTQAEALGLTTEQTSGHLGQDARAVTAFAIGGHCAAMAQVGYGLDGLRDDVMAGLTTQPCDKPDAARVVFETRVVQPAGSGK